jgi:molecular chaperone GrpE
MKTEQDKGLALVLSNFTDVLKKEGLKEIDCNGVYDPYRHEVIMTKESKEKEGVVLDVVRKGYALNDIMLRPASVIVSEGIGKKEETKKE